MRSSCLKLLAAASLALGLSACAARAPIISASDAHVSVVQVEMKQDVAAPGFAEQVSARSKREATRFGAAGAPKRVHVLVTGVHHKNPAMSLLVGDANHAQADVVVYDVATGRPQGQFRAATLDNGLINGVIGAAMAATQDKNEVNQRLAGGLAEEVMRGVYGDAAWTEGKKRPVVETVAPPASAPAPAAPAPKKRAEPRTSMVAPPEPR
jgi:hypothetical protein